MESTNDNDTTPSTTSIKRKADEAFDALDDALRPKEGRPSPPKRANTSFYGSLARYGIINQFSTSSKTPAMPTLTALLSRARTRKSRKPLSLVQYSKSSSAAPEYSPGSTEAFLKRLSTFTFSTYPSKPTQIDAVAAAKAGWINEGGKNRLYCAICRIGWIVAGCDGMNKDAADALVEKQRESLVSMHKEGCPWRIRQCDLLVYRIPLRSPTTLARLVYYRAIELDSLMDGISIRHPLTSNQIQTFVQIVSSVTLPRGESPSPSGEFSTQPPVSAVSTASLLAALFGWSLALAPSPLERKSSSASITLARTHSRSSSVAGPSRESTPIPMGSHISVSLNTPSKADLITPSGTSVTCKSRNSMSEGAACLSPISSRRIPLQKDAVLHCQMCQRRVGLWAFAARSPPSAASPAESQPPSTQITNNPPQRQLDLLREHRSYCPYVVKSTPLVSLPSYPPLVTSSSSATPRTSFNLVRTGTSSSVGENRSSSSPFNLRRATSLLSDASSHARTGSVSSGGAFSSSDVQEHNLVEGWRAVYSTVLRYGMAERSRVAAQPPFQFAGGEKAEDDAMSGVVELVESVKRHGGKQLLSYVRNLLG